MYHLEKKIESQGENITLNNTAKTPFEVFKVTGNSVQETRSGKNMINVLKNSLTTNGITFTNNGDGSVTINGTATDVAFFSMMEQTFTLEQGQTYSAYLGGTTDGLAMTVRTTSSNQGLIYLPNAQETSTTTYNRETVDDAYAYIRVETGTTLNNVTVYPMLVKGNEIGDWEAYGAMPSPEFISKIENVESKNILINRMENQTAVGVEITINKDKSITLNGTATSNAWINVTNNLKLRAGDYILSLKNKISGLGLYLGSDSNTDYAVTQSTTNGEKTFNLQEETIFDVARLRIMSGTVFNNLTIYPMLEEGTVATEYKPNGINVTVGNKNWVEVDNINKEYITMNGDGTFTINGILQQNDNFKFISSLFLPAGKYRMSLGIDYNKFNKSYYNISANGEQLKYYNHADISFELEEDANINATTVLIAGTYSNLIVKPMIERTDSESSSDWVEHQEQIVNFPLAQGQKLYLGDYLAADGIHHVRKQIELDGTESWFLSGINYYTSIPGKKLRYELTKGKMLCTHFKETEGSASTTIEVGEFFEAYYREGNRNVFFNYDNGEGGVDNFKSYLAAQKQAGTPVIVEYELAEEETEAYTPEQQEAYNQINSLYSYDEVTNIFSNNEISPIFDVSIFKMITEEFKERLLNGKITRAYLKVLATDTQSEFTIDENNYLKDLTFEELRYVPEEGFIGGTVAKRVTGNFNNIDNSFSIQDREFELYMGVDLEDETTEYIKYGTYIVQKPEDDQVNDNTSFEALDYMIKLNLPWVDRMTYPCTLKELFDDLVAQSGLSTKVTSFLNQNFIVENNQFEEGTTRRDVLKAIAQMAFNWARIDEDNDIVMDFEKKDEVAETLTADNYYNFKKQDMYGPINVIVLRNSQVEGENITIRDEESIAQYGETELVISDNPFAYTQAKRAELIEAGRILFGLTYIPMSMDMIGYMYLNCKDKIKATNLNNETFETYLLNHTIEYAGTISDSMEAPASTKTETQYQFTPPMIEALKHTELLVDKANQRIDAVIKNISDTNEKMVEIEATLEGVTSTVSEVVKKTNETSEKVDNLKSGANNLIVNSGYFNNTDGWKANGDGITLSVENFDGFNCIKATGSIVYAYDELPLYNAGFIRLEPNSTYIIQLEMYLYRELAEGETDITYPITNSSPLHTYINSMKSTGVVMSGNSAIDSENGASVKKTLLSSSSYKTNEWVKIQLKIETGNPTLDYPYYAIKPFIWGTAAGITDGNTVYMKNIYVKQTNIISDWSPSQNDIVNDLDENYYTKSETQSQIKQTSDSLTSQISNIESEISSTNGDIIGIKTQISEVQQKLDGLTTNITSTGGNNLFRNSVGYFGSDFWTGELKSYTSTEVKNNSVSGNAIMLQNSNLSQTVFVKNGYYNISFIYKKLIELASCKLRINGYEIELTELDITEFERNFQVTDNTITFEIISDTNDACYISDLLLIAGQYKQTWTQNQNETVTDTVRIGQGIEVVSSKTNTKLLADSDGVRINNVLNNNTIAEFTDKGTTTENLIVNETAQIAGLLIQKIGEQVCFNVL